MSVQSENRAALQRAEQLAKSGIPFEVVATFDDSQRQRAQDMSAANMEQILKEADAAHARGEL